MPVSISVPLPILVRLPVPEIVPENVVLVLSLPVVSMAEPSVALPAPASEPMVWLKLLRSRVAPLATVNALNGENALTTPACSVPALTDVAPVYVLLPDSVSVPVPILVSPPGPLIAPERVALLPLVSTVPPAACNTIGSALAILAPAISKVPPVKTGPGEPLGPDASVQDSAPEVLALKVRPAASKALPFEQMPGNSGPFPTLTVATTVLVAVLMTETVLLFPLAT